MKREKKSLMNFGVIVVVIVYRGKEDEE